MRDFCFFLISRLTRCSIVLADLRLIFWIFLGGSGAGAERGIRNDFVGGVEISVIITGSSGSGRSARFDLTKMIGCFTVTCRSLIGPKLDFTGQFQNEHKRKYTMNNINMSEYTCFMRKIF